MHHEIKGLLVQFYWTRPAVCEQTIALIPPLNVSVVPEADVLNLGVFDAYLTKADLVALSMDGD